MIDPATRATQLIELACSTTSDEEARTAALSAAKLIKKHGLRVSAETARTVAFGTVDLADLYRRHEQRVYDSLRRSAERVAQSQRRERPPPAEAPPRGTWKVMVGSSRCFECSATIEDGQVYYCAATDNGGRQHWCRGH